jgi:hypothetical protein
MPKTPKKQVSDNRWEREHMKIVNTKVRRELAEAFKAKCHERGTSCHAVLKKAIEDYMEEE